MAATPITEAAPEVPSWLKSLPSAPEYHPTATEFEDPIAYILKIEREASRYGICKIVPPLPPAPRKTAVANLNRCLAALRGGGGGGDTSSTFTTRQQQIGVCQRRQRPAQRPVWQSGEHYTVEEFECKAKSFERSFLGHGWRKKSPSALEIESLYWKSCSEKPFSVEYANDMPGSAFSGAGARRRRRETAESVGETAWNMQGVSRARGSLLRYMKEEIAGVTSPMVYIGMLFSWFAWHVEDHDLHSLNYMHLGAAKTWYGVPRDAAAAFEEVIRVDGYGGEINPLVTFAILGEKTTVMSPEVFINAGIPCCRLVQNAGEFVVTFPRAYHSGFSHGFNCGEAANIATPEWLKVAKDAAIRRASISYPPMVSHVQLLYDLTLELFSSSRRGSEPRSSRLKDRKKGEGESVVKEHFVRDVISRNELLFNLTEEGRHLVILLPRDAPAPTTSHSRVRHRESFIPSFTPGFSDLFPAKGHFAAFCGRYRLPPFGKSEAVLPPNRISTDQKENGLPDQGFSCVACGILSFPCYAIVRPRDSAARYLMSAESSFLNDWVVSSEATSDCYTHQPTDAIPLELSSSSGPPWAKEKPVLEGLYDVPIRSGEDFPTHVAAYQCNEAASDDVVREDGPTALRLLAMTYGGDDSDRDISEPGSPPPAAANSWPEASWCGNTVGPTGRVHVDPISPDSTDHEDHAAASDEVLEDQERFHLPPDRIPGRAGRRCRAGGGDEAAVPPTPQSGSSKTHVFCLEHAVEVRQQLGPIGGAHVSLVCYPEYRDMEAEARALAEEMQMEQSWNTIEFREACRDEESLLRQRGRPEELPGGSGDDWAVKLGLHLGYSAGLSRSPLYSKQLPYNPVIEKAFGRRCTGPEPGPGPAGRWCGKVWMWNQVHPMLCEGDPEEIRMGPARIPVGRKRSRGEEGGGGRTRRRRKEVVGPTKGHGCEVEGCGMRFGTKKELEMHGQNICTEKGCGKKLFSHKYLVQHGRVHVDERPLKCPWRGCKMAFKWAWARTEHIRVHTGARPYLCAEPGCHHTFRFVSDFSRHKRKTGHSAPNKPSSQEFQ